MRKKHGIIMALLCMLMFVLTACGGGDKAATAPAEKDTLIVADGASPKTLDPRATNDNVSARVMVQIYDTLVEQDENTQIQPGLAESWEQADDVTTIFHLRKGVKFHNGEELKASDVKFSLDAMKASPQTSEIIEPLKEVVVLDDYTVKVVTEFPFAPILNHLAHPTASIVNEKAVKEAGESYGQHPVGTGPFKFVDWQSGDRVTLEANEEYYKGASPIKHLIFKNVVEITNRTIGLETGEIDIAYDIEGLDKLKIAEDPKLNLVEDLDLSMVYLGFNLKKAPFDNIKVRQAIAYAIDQQPIIDTAFQGAAFPANSIIGPKIFAHSDKGIKYQQNLEKAKALLAEAGYRDGFKTEIWINDNPTRRDIAVILQDQLKQVGIDVEVKTLEWGAYLDGTARGDHQMFILGWGTVTADPDYGINNLVSTKTVGAAGNRSFYSNPKVDELLQKGRSTIDPEARKAIYEEIQVILQEDLPMYYIVYPKKTVGMQKYIEGFKFNPAGHHRIYGVSFKAE
ncbi:ABC transporter, substrate-binding protein, family 5 [Fusobacterium gonidiaformans 3-1-5R]|uniref:ABC transporter, substrate-binding protein, family 5 n=2 Tax=Fusobacterium TaxID=848 RepID=E5BGX2_9FUSO|nr:MULTISPECIES: glutathione ABC transporter substrate-binding protein [Fusobacterium]AVQ16837.1 glutathione ABC transporter substrate-binding protein [Fusobacterium gonidiaformans ATCC 25563]EFS21745.1 ABC transporter, substrate-binding protein, family 5 [Fusobacterium gonidiaformans 3-1-5R]EFS28420.1 hypothetical protein FGAG_00741 [Fusobacterium gonidiaformans ATCC 25563]KXA13126.1 ABC transporter, substrate-binding protein, family 5 [Fusobacterium equinum]